MTVFYCLNNMSWDINLLGVASDALDAVGAIGDKASQVKDSITQMGESLVDTIKDAKDLVSNFFDGIIGKIADTVMNIFKSITDGITNAISTVGPSGSSFYDNLNISYNIVDFGGDVKMIYLPLSTGKIMTYIAIVLLLLIFVYSLFLITLSPITEQKNTILELIARFFLSLLAICSIRYFFGLINYTFASLINLTQSSDTQSLTDVANSMEGITAGDVALILFSAILIIMLIVEIIKTIIELIERYIVNCVLCYCAPMAGCCLVSRNTSNIFINYIKMFISQNIVMTISIIFFTLFAENLLINYMLGHTYDFTYLMFMYAFLKCFQKIDENMNKLGLSVAQTGGNLADSLVRTFRAMKGAAATGLNMGATGAKAAGVATNNPDLFKSGLGLQNASDIISGRVPNIMGEAQKMDAFERAGGMDDLNRKASDKNLSPKSAAAIVNNAARSLENGNSRILAKIPNGDMRKEAIQQYLNNSGAKQQIARAMGVNPNSLNLSKAGIDPRTGNMKLAFTDDKGITRNCTLGVSPSSSVLAGTTAGGYSIGLDGIDNEIKQKEAMNNVLNGLNVNDLAEDYNPIAAITGDDFNVPMLQDCYSKCGATGMQYNDETETLDMVNDEGKVVGAFNLGDNYNCRVNEPIGFEDDAEQRANFSRSVQNYVENSGYQVIGEPLYSERENKWVVDCSNEGKNYQIVVSGLTQEDASTKDNSKHPKIHKFEGKECKVKIREKKSGGPIK